MDSMVTPHPPNPAQKFQGWWRSLFDHLTSDFHQALLIELQDFQTPQELNDSLAKIDQMRQVASSRVSGIVWWWMYSLMVVYGYLSSMFVFVSLIAACSAVQDGEVGILDALAFLSGCVFTIAAGFGTVMVMRDHSTSFRVQVTMRWHFVAVSVEIILFYVLNYFLPIMTALWVSIAIVLVHPVLITLPLIVPKDQTVT